jgi:NDP-sugar pyrophosphorylase family protein
VAAHVAAGRWFELSTIPRYLDISLLLLSENGETVSAGAGCKLSAAADISDSVLWDDVVIEPEARVKRAVIGDKVRIGSGEVVENAVVVCASLIQGKTPPPKALKGEFRGDNFVVPLTE